MKHCFLVPPKGRGTLAVEGSERFAKRYDQDISGDVQRGKETLEQTAQGIAAGSISISTIGEQMRQAGIPTSQQPIKQKKTPAGYQYQYQVHDAQGKPRIGIVTDQTTDRVVGHGPHWEAGLGACCRKHLPRGRGAEAGADADGEVVQG